MAIIGELHHQIGKPEIAKPAGTPRNLMKSITYTSGVNVGRYAS